MYIVQKEILRMAHKPFDLVTDRQGSVGFISEVDINNCQPGPKNQISYSVIWLIGKQSKVAWW